MTVEKTLLSPPLYDTLMSLKREIFKEIRCVLPGRITSFDSTSRTVQVTIAMAQVMPDGSTRPYPPLVDVPVLTLQGGGMGVAFPIVAGDECLVFFSDRCIDSWFQNGIPATGTTPPPPTGRLHDLSDGFALVGPNSLSKALDLALDSDEGGIADANAKVAVKSGKVTIQNATQSLKTILDTLLTAMGTATTVAQIATAANTAKTAMDLLLY